MSNRTPYDGYEPNEPHPADEGQYGRFARPPAGAASARPQADGQRGWEGLYPPNEPDEAPDDAPGENPYFRPTWDEAPYRADEPPRARRARPATYDAPEYDGEAAPDSAPAYEGDAYFGSDPDAGGDPDAYAPAGNAQSPYGRPAPLMQDDAMIYSSRFAPPLKFELPRSVYAPMAEPATERAPGEPTLYQTRRPAYEAPDAGLNPTAAGHYRVEAEDDGARRKWRRRRVARRLLIALFIVAGLAVGAYLARDFLLAQLGRLLGQEAAETVNQAVNQAIGGEKPAVAGYDAAPALQVADQAAQGIQAVAGSLGLQTYAVTASSVVARRPDGQGSYEVYLFAANDGRLLGYYEGVSENGFLVCADDVFYVEQPPYLITSRGVPLIDPSRYRQAAGDHAELGPLMGGWSVISNVSGTSFNYINMKGEMLSTLWFAKAFPFTAEATLAYVDTGNVQNPDERYALYRLTRDGDMSLWKHAADMDEVAGCAAGVAVLNDGSVVRLNKEHTVLCTTDEAAVYADCGALVARDPATKLYGLYVYGDKQYDFAYDSIAPVASDIRWAESGGGLYRLLHVTDRPYPLPLSHYFTLIQGDAQDLVALSTGSVYPLLLP